MHLKPASRNMPSLSAKHPSALGKGEREGGEGTLKSASQPIKWLILSIIARNSKNIRKSTGYHQKYFLQISLSTANFTYSWLTFTFIHKNRDTVLTENKREKNTHVQTITQAYKLDNKPGSIFLQAKNSKIRL